MEVTAADCDGPDPNDDIPGARLGWHHLLHAEWLAGSEEQRRAGCNAHSVDHYTVRPSTIREGVWGRPTGAENAIDCYIDTVTVYEGP